MKTRDLSEIGILIALAVVLEVVFTGLASFFPVLVMPQGGRVSLSMLPLFIIAYRHGVGKGILGGIIYSLLNLLMDGVLWHWASFFLDYVVAFGLIGVSAIILQSTGKNKSGFTAMVVLGVILRFISHYLSGVVLFAEYMPDTFDNIYFYSFVYNAYYLVPSMILCIVVGILMFKRLEATNIFE